MAFRVGPAQLSLAWLPVALSTGTLVLPRMTQPAARIRATTGASVPGIRSVPPAFEQRKCQPPCSAAGDVHRVLDDDRHARERPQGLAGGPAGIDRPRLVKGVGVEKIRAL